MDTLLDTTKTLLAARTAPLHVVAAEADVGKEWLRKFSRGIPNDPGVRKVQKLHDYLANQ